MADFREQRAVVKFSFLLRKSGTETLEMLKTAYKDDAMGKTLTKNGMTPVPHPPYSPDLAPCDFFLFPRMKRDMKGKRFADVAEVKEKTTEALSSISKDEFRQCFEKWNKRLDKCISVSGEYFQED
ncbi:hypothetical protein B7P43_G01174 [Cryptotermes secundus]|uniref:Mos1 transposase HTH domain-containing protein n=1 Tax=Cryptotermes secundus TaxID=105785 RepID=A0A2J7QZX7_9NEOP|nr:hypothetical protein B7P43_G01174 [Cryptotermes secundus]